MHLDFIKNIVKMKYKILFLLALSVIFASKCSSDEEEITVFDYADQARKDNDSLVKYMQTHYYDSADGLLKKIDNNQTSVYSETAKLKTQEIPLTFDKYDDGVDGSITVNYKLYYYTVNEGLYETPTKVDSTFVSYKGMLLDHTVFDQSQYGSWFQLRSTITGWTYGLEHFKYGDYSVNADQSFNFVNQGKGILFIPSGLAYNNLTTASIPANSPLIFYFSLNMIKRTDYDKDGLYSKYEDINNNGNFNDDDTDGDGYPNYLDADDDGDGTLTKNENADPNTDHNPSDAYNTNHSDSPDVPDYLDKNTK